MIIDASMIFDQNVPVTVSRVSTNSIDLQGILITSGSQYGGALQGRDLNGGDGIQVPKMFALVMTTFTGGTSLNVQFQGAPDNGSGSPGTYNTFAETGAIPVASLIAGFRVFEIDLPGPISNFPLPRFVQLNYVTVGTFTTGALYSAVVLSRDEIPQGPGALWSGHRPGFAVAN